MENQPLTKQEWKLLEQLQLDGRISISELANQLGRSRGNISELIDKMKDKGILQNFSVLVDEEKLGFGISAFVRIQAGSSQHRKIVQSLCELPEVAECHVLTGSELVIVRVVAKHMRHLREIVDGMTCFGETHTDVIFSSVKRQLKFDDELEKRLKAASK